VSGLGHVGSSTSEFALTGFMTYLHLWAAPACQAGLLGLFCNIQLCLLSPGRQCHGFVY